MINAAKIAAKMIPLKSRLVVKKEPAAAAVEAPKTLLLVESPDI